MKTEYVTITETLRRIIEVETVEDETRGDAIARVIAQWDRGDIILDADDFVAVNFE